MKIRSQSQYKSKYVFPIFKLTDGNSLTISPWRLLLQYVFLLVIFLTLGYSLFKLQIVEGDENLFLSGANKEKEEILKAPRGLIFDQNGIPLVYNSPSFRVMFDNSNIIENEDISVIREDLYPLENEQLGSLSKILGEDNEKLREKYLEQTRDEKGRIFRNENVTLFKGLSRDEALAIYPNLSDLPSIYIAIDEKRVYNYPNELAPILGYIGEVTKDDLVANETLTYIDDIGKEGIEYVYDSELRGINGRKIAQQDIENNVSTEYISVYAKKGKDLELYLDLQVQKKFYELLEKEVRERDTLSGAIAIQDAKSGGIIGAASYPSYNPNKLSENIADYLSNEDNVFLNRFVSAYPPGSTFKTYTASVLLQEGVIDQESSFKDRGTLELGGGVVFQNYKKRSLGTLRVRDALALSSNLFFCNYSLKTSEKIFEKYASGFHIGQKTGIDLTNESSGQLGTPEIKKELANEIWYPGDNCNLAVGQGYTTVTPVQLLSWVNAIANDGEYVRPRVVKSITDHEEESVTEFGRTVDGNLGIDIENLEIVKEGMHQAVMSGANGIGGTGGYLRGIADVASKTGTAEATVKRDGIWVRDTHAWVTGFFPYEDPQYTFVLFLEGGGVGGNDAAPLMKEFLEWFTDYEGLNFEAGG